MFFFLILDLPQLINEDDMRNDDSENENDEDWIEMDDNSEDKTRCLFCTNEFPNIESAIQHLNDNHKVNLSIIKAKFQMDFYSYIKVCFYFKIFN